MCHHLLKKCLHNIYFLDERKNSSLHIRLHTCLNDAIFGAFRTETKLEAACKKHGHTFYQYGVKKYTNSSVWSKTVVKNGAYN